MPPLALLTVLLLALLAHPTARPAAAQGRFAAVPCWFPVPDGEAAFCGTLSVPERRDRPSARTLRLAVAVLRSTAATPAPDPVLFIEGGPGASVFGVGEPAEERMEGWWEVSAPFRRSRDVILFDPRGVGRSEPDTNCTELDALAAGARGRPLPRERREAKERAALEACVHRLKEQGVDLTSFSTAAAADDVAELVAALGASRVNLFAVSYGTRVALEMVRRHGPQVRSAVLDSIYPPDVNALEEEAWLAHRAVRRLFDDCTAGRGCRAVFPELERRFIDLLARLQRSPAEVPVGDDMVPLTVRLDGHAALAAVLEAMAEGEPVPGLPATIAEAAAGRLERLARFAPIPWMGDPETAEGMAFAIECRETVNPADPARAAANARRWALPGLPPGLAADDSGGRVCALWPTGQQEALERLPVASTVPVLLISGAYDPVTPPEWGRRAASTLPQSRHLVFRARGHVVTGSDACALDAAAAFIERPDPARAPACPSAAAPPRFERP